MHTRFDPFVEVTLRHPTPAAERELTEYFEKTPGALANALAVVILKLDEMGVARVPPRPPALTPGSWREAETKRSGL